MPLVRTKSYLVTCDKCGRGESFIIKDTQSAREYLKSKGWTEKGKGIFCPEHSEK